MAASSAADIPESKSDYCPCNRCTVARKQGRQEIIDRVRKVLMYWVYDISNTTEQDYYMQIVEALDGEQ